MNWQFWIDVGGTFTDGVACAPDGTLQTAKVLSSGVTKGTVGRWGDSTTLIDPDRVGEPARFWNGYRLQLVDAAGVCRYLATVERFDHSTGTLSVTGWEAVDRNTVPAPTELQRYELVSPEEAPLLIVRKVLGLPLESPIPPCEMRLGTTRGTNALLERKGSAVGLITTLGFADVLRIANQDRPRLFDLAIRKPTPLSRVVVEAEERIAADGSVLYALNETSMAADLRRLKHEGIQSLAVCLVHSWVNPDHELAIERLARNLGFKEISLSHQVSPRIKIVPRGDTAVLDAYLNPVLRDYVEALQTTLGRTGRLRIMTSAGGLVPPSGFTGKDSLLSGPAGGVVGCARVAEQAGFSRAIGFDMGGTSTDVTRYDGQFEYESESFKAGVRVATPHLAIETVAAGGGSRCGFDGVQLFVGPESAGADPGPACYGRGGPLTVTDCNLMLGRLRSDHFPFPLDQTAVERRLREVCEALESSALAVRYTPIELAAGFLELANANMVRAIRRVSVAKGYDPTDFALVTFGGAGGMHACALADSLGMTDIIVHPYAGVLSAYGIGLADVRRQAERMVLQPLTDETIAALSEPFEALGAALKAEILSEGIEANRIAPARRSLNLRYQGVEATIPVPASEDRDYRAEFERRHQQLYGYLHQSRSIEIASLAVEVVGRTADPPEAIEAASGGPARAFETQPLWVNGDCVNTSVYRRCDLSPGQVLTGPALLCEPTSTLVIEPGWQGRVTANGTVCLHRDADASRQAATAGRTESANDPVVLEIINNQFASIAEQMGVTLQRTAISTNVKERLDFSCAVFDPQGNLIVNAPHIPVHLGAMGETVRAVLADNPDLQPGDVIVTNDPYRGGSHLPDITVVTPVYDPGGTELLFLTASRAHHAEIGGIVPGSIPPFSRNLAEEGVLIQNFRLVAGGRSREAALQELLLTGPYPTRRIADNLADIAAQVAANHWGAEQLLQLAEREGRDRLAQAMRGIRAAAAAKLRRALVQHGSGVYRWTDHLDDGSPIVVAITIDDGHATVDFTGTGPVLATNLNANRAIVTAAVIYVFRCLIDEDIPLNDGVLEPVRIVLPVCLLNPPANDDPQQCPAIVGGNVETSQRVVDALLGALRLAAASQGTMNNLAIGDAKFGYYETICGGSGATSIASGADAVHTHMTNTRLTDLELLEYRYPVRVRRFGIRTGSGGAGRYRGGDGVERELEFLVPLSVAMLTQRRGEYLPFGLQGGQTGAKGQNLYCPAGSDDWENLGGAFQKQMAPGDRLKILTPGGGGWGERPL